MGSASDQPNRHTVLGTLVDRAVCMPYAKPQILRRGRRRYRGEDGRWRSAATITEDVAEAASLLVKALSSRFADREWSKAELAVDPAGPWWSKPRDDFLSLGVDEREWVLDRVEDTAQHAATALEQAAVKRDWTWMWSQPSFAKPGKVRPNITRPDIVGGLDWRHCEVIDLKTTSQGDLGAVVKASEQARLFASWTTSLSALRFIPVRCSVLTVSTAEMRWEWTPFELPEEVAEHS